MSKSKFTDEDMKKYCLIKSDEEGACMMCMDITPYIDYTCEVRFCSKECSDDFYDIITQQEKFNYGLKEE